MGMLVEGTRKLLLVIAVAVVLVAAGGLALAARLPPSSPPSEDRLAFSLTTDHATYTVGQVANLTVTLTNVGPTTAVLTFNNPCFWEFLAYDEAGHAVFNSSYLRACIQMIAKVTLQPGQMALYCGSWALVTDQGTPVPAPASYRLEPSFVWYYPGYQAEVVSTESATVAVNP